MTPKPRGLDQNEQDASARAKQAGASESEIAAQLAGLSQQGTQRGYGMLDSTAPQVSGLQQQLADLVSGKQSFVDDNVAQQQFNRAREAAAGEYRNAEQLLADRYAKRGLSGGGQQRGELAGYVVGQQAKTLSNQATDIYADVARRKAAERAGALDSLLANVGQQQGLGLQLAGMGQQALGQSGSMYGNVAGNMNQNLSTMLNRPMQKSLFEQLTGAAIGAAGAAGGLGWKPLGKG